MCFELLLFTPGMGDQIINAMRNERDVDVLFAMADLAFSENRIEEAKGLLEEILVIDPKYGRAYNHLGWFYATQIDDMEKAEEFFTLAPITLPVTSTWVGCTCKLAGLMLPSAS